MADAIQVLYVDDNSVSLRIHSRNIAEQGHIDVIVESTVEDGLAQLVDSDIDCILSDLEMPDHDGLEFLSAVRNTHPHLPFIIFSGNECSDVIETALASGATDFIPKSTCSVSYRLVTNRITNAVDHYQMRA